MPFPRSLESDLRPAVDVVLGPAQAPDYSALVSLRGEHDLATNSALRDTLGRLHGSVLIDLSDCEFADATVIEILLSVLRALRLEGHRLELLVPLDNDPVNRLLDVLRIRDLVRVHDRLPPTDWTCPPRRDVESSAGE